MGGFPDTVSNVSIWRLDSGWFQCNVQQKDSGGWRVSIYREPRVAFLNLGYEVDEQTISAILAECDSWSLKMGRPKGSKNTKKDGEAAAPKAGKAPEIESALRNHLAFVGIASRDLGEPYQTHCLFNNGALIAFDGVVAAGVMIEEKITAAPHTHMLLKALDRIGSEFAMTVSGSVLNVKHGKLSINVPCFDPSAMHPVTPDNPTIAITNELKEAFKAVSPIVKENATTVLEASIFLTGGSVVATDRLVMLEYWHGLPLPALVLPKALAQAIIKTPKNLAWFGYSENSATFWFDDNSFIRSQLYNEAWPETWASILPTALQDETVLNAEFWGAFDAIADFSESNFLHCFGEVIQTDTTNEPRASYALPGADWDFGFDVKRTKMVRPYMHRIGYADGKNVLGFFSENNTVRGAMGMPVTDTPEAQQRQAEAREAANARLASIQTPAAPAADPEPPFPAAPGSGMPVPGAPAPVQPAGGFMPRPTATETDPAAPSVPAGPQPAPGVAPEEQDASKSPANTPAAPGGWGTTVA